MDEQELNMNEADQELLEKGLRQAALIQKLLHGEISEPEQRELDNLTDNSDESRRTVSDLTNPLGLNTGLDELDHFAKNLEQAKAKVMNVVLQGHSQSPRQFKRMWKLISIAAIFLVVVGAGLLWLMRKPASAPEVIVKTERAVDIAPGSKKAMLLLDDGGKSLDLTDYTDSSFIDDGIRLTNHQGRLVYDQESNASKVSFHTIVVPKAGEYQVMLEDGTKVWLNAESSLRYPTQFAANERTVELKGEGYFEVVKSPNRPFKVLVDSMLVTVTGTEFNINAYHDEALLKSTLFNGKVKISRNAIAVDLVPGQQLQLDRNTNDVRIIEKPDLEAAVAWKDGLFKLTSADIPTIMRQVARWYDIEIVYQGAVPRGHISGIIPRNLNLSEVLKVLQESGVKFEFEGNKLTILP